MAIPRLQKAVSFQEGSPGIRCTVEYSTASLQKAPCYLFSLPSSKVTGLSKRETEAHADIIVVVQSLSRVQLFCDSIDCSPPGSSVHGISQARILQWFAISFSSRHLMSYFLLLSFARFPDSSVGKESACNAGDPQFDSWVGKISWRRDSLPTSVFLGFPCGSAGKESACNAGDLGSIPGLGRSPGERKGYPLQYSGLENSMDYTGGKELDTTESLSLSSFAKQESKGCWSRSLCPVCLLLGSPELVWAQKKPGQKPRMDRCQVFLLGPFPSSPEQSFFSWDVPERAKLSSVTLQSALEYFPQYFFFH